MNQEPFPIVEPQMSQGPRPFSEIPPLWLKFFRMTEEFFNQEAPRFGNANTFLAVLIASVFGAILGVISQFTSSSFQSSWMKNLYPESIPQDFMPQYGIGATGLFLIALLALSIAAFYISAGLVYFTARLLGGNGSFGIQAYLFSLITVPMSFLSGLVNIIPCIGWLITIGLSIFALVLEVRAVKVAHNLTSGKAAGAVLIPVALLFVAVWCLLIIGIAVFLNMYRAL